MGEDLARLAAAYDAALGMSGVPRRYDGYAVLAYFSPTAVPLFVLSFRLIDGTWEQFSSSLEVPRDLVPPGGVEPPSPG